MTEIERLEKQSERLGPQKQTPPLTLTHSLTHSSCHSHTQTMTVCFNLNEYQPSCSLKYNPLTLIPQPNYNKDK